MSLVAEKEIRTGTVAEIAKRIMIAAKTAPKGRGIDNIEIAMADGDTIRLIADTLKEMAANENAPAFFIRDAENILNAEAVILFGAKIKSTNLVPCGMCGFVNCDAKNENPDHPCVFNVIDLGIAIGSAVSLAADNRVDNRVMYTIGQAALKLNLMGEDTKIIFGLPLSVSSKSPFFDRK